MKNMILIRVAELATQNFNLYPEDYEIKDGLATNDASEAAQDLAISYFNNREDLEIEQENELDITQIDYVEAVMTAFSEWVQECI